MSSSRLYLVDLPLLPWMAAARSSTSRVSPVATGVRPPMRSSPSSRAWI
jgi:hypothetical protein